MTNHRRILWIVPLVFALFCPLVSAQVVKIAGVPDWNQPLDYNLAPDSFVQPLDGPPFGAPNGVANWCTPTAGSNMMGWFEDQQGYAGLADGIAYNAVPNRCQPYPNLDTGGGLVDLNPDWQQNQWLDGTIEMGFQMDTQGWASGGAGHFGTSFGANVADCPGGLLAYLNLYYPAVQWTAWQYDIWNDGTLNGAGAKASSWDDYLDGGCSTVIPALATVPNDGVRHNSSPVLVTVDKWVDPNAQAPHKYDDQQGTVWYDWNTATSGAHTVIGIGYAINYDPDGAGVGLPASNWLIAHDGWGNTPTDVAVPWDAVFMNNIWWANTHAIPEPATLAMLLIGGFALLLKSKSH